MFLYSQVDYMEPIVEMITLVEDARFDSPKSMFLGRVMGKNLTHQNTCGFNLAAELIYL